MTSYRIALVEGVSRQMRFEREHCLDDIAVAACGNAFRFAAALAEMAQLRRGISAAVLALSLAATSTIVSLSAAPQEPPPAFDVASIKRDVNGQHVRFTKPFPTLHIEGATVRDLITVAYHVHSFEVSGGPAWIDSDLYAIDAKAASPPTPNPQFVALQWRRLQTLLHDRFGLIVHRETKELPIYELSVAKGGPKLRPATCVQRVTGDTAIAPGKTQADYCGGNGFSKGRVESRSMTMPFLADMLSILLDRTVVNKTGIAGEFEVHLTYTPDPSPSSSADAAATADPGADIFTAMQEQLGLKLQPAKGPVEILVIDRVERPTEN